MVQAENQTVRPAQQQCQWHTCCNCHVFRSQQVQLLSVNRRACSHSHAASKLNKYMTQYQPSSKNVLNCQQQYYLTLGFANSSISNKLSEQNKLPKQTHGFCCFPTPVINSLLDW